MKLRLDTKMQINPGGRLNTDDIIGRDDDIRRYWQILERQSLVLSAERRIGKTHIAYKMRAEAPPNIIVFYQDLEGVHNVLELIRATYRSVSAGLNFGQKVKGKVAAIWSSLQLLRRKPPGGSGKSAGICQ